MAERRQVRINGYPIDLAKNETITYPSKVTPRPAESGSDFVDNIKNDPVQIELECLVSDTPIGRIATDETRSSLGDGALPSEDAHARLMAVRAAKQPIVVETTRGTFQNMVMVNLSEPSNSTTTGGLTFTVSLTQIVVKSNRRSRVRVATNLPNGVVNFGLSLDKLTDGKRFLWRKGKPPGTSPATEPPGEIVGTEVLTSERGVTRHLNGKALTEKEKADFSKDLLRDAQLSELRNLDRLANDPKSKLADASAARTTDNFHRFQDAKVANPGKAVDPHLFGLSGKPEAFDPNDQQQVNDEAARNRGLGSGTPPM